MGHGRFLPDMEGRAGRRGKGKNRVKGRRRQGCGCRQALEHGCKRMEGV